MDGFLASHRSNVFYKGTTLEVVDTRGYGLQAVRKCLAMNPAPTAEGRSSLEAGLFRKLFSRAVPHLPDEGFWSLRAMCFD